MIGLLLAWSFAWSAPKCTLSTELTGVVGPATVDFLKRAERQAATLACDAILLRVNTPGGNLESTRRLVEGILASPIPYLCLVAPSGGHAGSAGAILLQACHVNGGLHGTNLGAATPVSMGGELPSDLRQKIMNDTRSWVEGLTTLRGRNAKFGQDIILEAKAVTAEEAFKLKALDFVGDDVSAFLKAADGRQVKVAGRGDVRVQTGPLETFAPDTRFQVLAMLTDPEFAYMLLLASVGLLYFEVTHSGVIVPGIAGAVGLVISMIALHKLDVEWGGMLLIFIGIGLIIAEMFLPTFGLVGAAGVGALGLGSLFLFDPVRTFGYHLPYGLVAGTTAICALLLFGVSYLFVRTTRVRKRGGFDDLLGERARVVAVHSATTGTVELRGELWSFETDSPLALEDHVTIKGHHGLTLRVAKE